MHKRRRFSINVISGHFLPHNRHLDDPRRRTEACGGWRVVVKMLGSSDAKDMPQSFTTKDSSSSSWAHSSSLSSPSLDTTWSSASRLESECFTFQPDSPETTSIYISLFDSTNVSGVGLAHSCVPLTCIRPGYRIIPLYNKRCEPIFGWLFVRIWTDYAGSGVESETVPISSTGQPYKGRETKNMPNDRLQTRLDLKKRT